MNPNKPHNTETIDNLNPENLQNEGNENIQVKNNEKYQAVELEQNLNRPKPVSPQAPVQNSQTTNAPQDQSTDPVQQVKSMLSAGYTPSLELIQSASYFLKSNKTDDANVWFSVLFQKLIRELKN